NRQAITGSVFHHSSIDTSHQHLCTATVCFIGITKAVDLQNISRRRLRWLNASIASVRCISTVCSRAVIICSLRTIISRIFFYDDNIVVITAICCIIRVVATTRLNRSALRDTKITRIIITWRGVFWLINDYIWLKISDLTGLATTTAFTKVFIRDGRHLLIWQNIIELIITIVGIGIDSLLNLSISICALTAARRTEVKQG